ncbi:caspase family protein [Kitasatospora acidiphila]|uniref:caspase family protein n=1 Tax=Kitasatospora acidiphila TaxID=2567942 RepID=UPI003C71E865
MTDTDSRRDYSNSRAVLVGAWDYRHLERVAPAARNSFDRMFDLLIGPLCGWPRERVTLVGNKRSCGDLPHRLMRLYQGVTDVAMFYFVGHGQIYDDELCLALCDSPADPKDSSLRLTTGLWFEHVRKALVACDAKTKIVILDCCYSGNATVPGQTLSGAATEITDRASGTGAFTMAACEPNHVAWFEIGERDQLVQTYFTKYLIDTIEDGLPGRGEGLTLGDVFAATAEALVVTHRPRPTRSIRHEADQFIIARNPHPDAARVSKSELIQGQAVPVENDHYPDGLPSWFRRRRRRKYMTAGATLITLGFLGTLAFSLFSPSAPHASAPATTASSSQSTEATALLSTAFADNAGAIFLQSFSDTVPCSQTTSSTALQERWKSDGCTTATVGSYLEQTRTTGGSAPLMVSVEVIPFPSVTDADLAYGYVYGGDYPSTLWCPPNGAGHTPCAGQGAVTPKTKEGGAFRHIDRYIIWTTSLRTDVSAAADVYSGAVAAGWAAAYACGPVQYRGGSSFLISWE